MSINKKQVLQYETMKFISEQINETDKSIEDVDAKILEDPHHEETLNSPQFLTKKEGKSLLIISGSSNISLAKDMAFYIGKTVISTKRMTFADGECFVQIEENIRGCDVFIIQTLSDPVNDMIMELLLLVDAAKRASATVLLSAVTCLFFNYFFCFLIASCHILFRKLSVLFHILLIVEDLKGKKQREFPFHQLYLRKCYKRQGLIKSSVLIFTLVKFKDSLGKLLLTILHLDPLYCTPC